MPLNTSHALDARRNQLLKSLPALDWMRVQRDLEPIKLRRGDVISEAGAPLRHVYLPTTSTIALMYVTVNGASTEIARIGKEGLVGIALYMGGQATPARAVVQDSGMAYRQSEKSLNEEFRRAGPMQRILLLYAQARLMLVSQTAVCNRQHSIDQRLSRWLLSSLDRHEAAELSITHELISQSLGVRREGITEAVGKLQRLGIVSSSRGRLTIVNRSRLETLCCECYEVIRREYHRLLGGVSHSTGQAPLSFLSTASRSPAAVHFEPAMDTCA
jgi:CRP-like cAMP-binding protein